jgi:hypothetical protein
MSRKTTRGFKRAIANQAGLRAEKQLPRSMRALPHGFLSDFPEFPFRKSRLAAQRRNHGGASLARRDFQMNAHTFRLVGFQSSVNVRAQRFFGETENPFFARRKADRDVDDIRLDANAFQKRRARRALREMRRHFRAAFRRQLIMQIGFEGLSIWMIR